MCAGVSPSGGPRLYSRSHDAHAALPLRVSQTLHPAGALVEGGEAGAQVGRIPAVCGQKQEAL